MKNIHFIFISNIIVLLFFFLNPVKIVSQNENFENFIVKFSQDSIFQINRIIFPLKYITWDYSSDKEITVQIEKSKYKFDKLYYSLQYSSEAYTIFYDNFDCKFRDTDEMVFRWRGFTDMDRRYYFKRIDNKWFLVKILDYDPLE